MGLHDVRGAILDHTPPFLFSIDAKTITSMRAVHPPELLKLARQIHLQRCRPCTDKVDPTDLYRKIKGGLWAPAGRIELDMRLDSRVSMDFFNWDSVRLIADDIDLSQPAATPNGLFADGDEERSFHFVTTFSASSKPSDAPERDPRYLRGCDVQLKGISGFPDVFKVVQDAGRGLNSSRRPSEWPLLVGDTLVALTTLNSVFVDNTEALGKIKDPRLLDFASRYCVVFASPSAISARRVSTSLSWFHDIFLKNSYMRLALPLGMARGPTSPDWHSRHLCLELDVSRLFSSAASLETHQAMARRLKTYIWCKAVQLDRRVHGEKSADYSQCGGEDALDHLFDSIRSISKLPVFVALHGFDALYRRPLQTSLWVNTLHPTLEFIRQLLDDCVFRHLVRAYNDLGVVRKIVLTGTHLPLVVSGSALEALNPQDIASLPDAAPLHGYSEELLHSRLLLATDYIDNANLLTAKRLAEHFADRIRRVKREQALPGHAVTDPWTISWIFRSLRECAADSSNAAAEILEEQAIKAVMVRTTESLSELLFPLVRDDVPRAIIEFRDRAALDLNHRGVSGRPGLNLSGDTFWRSVLKGSSAWHDRIAAVLFTFGYLMTAAPSGAEHSDEYEVSGGRAQKLLLDAFDNHVAKYLPPCEPKAATISVETIVEVIEKLFSPVEAHNLPRTEEEFKKHVVKGIRDHLEKEGHLRSCVLTEVHVRYPEGLDTKSCDGRMDVVIHLRSESGPDYLYVLELKLRTLAPGFREPTRAQFEQSGRISDWEKTRYRQDQKHRLVELRCDLCDVCDLSPGDGWFVVRQSGYEKRPGNFYILRLGDIYTNYPKDKGGTSDPEHIEVTVGGTVVQLTKYIRAAVHGVVDEIGFEPGLAESRFTKLSDDGETIFVPIVAVSVGCSLVCVRELPREVMKGKLAVTETCPWTRDRVKGDSAVINPHLEAAAWSAFRTTDDVQFHKAQRRVHRI